MKYNIKKSFLVFGIAPFAVILLLSSACNKTDKKTAEESTATKNLNKAEQDLDKAKKEDQKNYEAFKIESERKISENQIIIAELKADAKNKSKSVKTDLNKDLEKLKEKNQELKVKMRNYKDESADNWDEFKTEFNRDMDNLGRALSELTKKNVE